MSDETNPINEQQKTEPQENVCEMCNGEGCVWCSDIERDDNDSDTCVRCGGEQCIEYFEPHAWKCECCGYVGRIEFHDDDY